MLMSYLCSKIWVGTEVAARLHSNLLASKVRPLIFLPDKINFRVSHTLYSPFFRQHSFAHFTIHIRQKMRSETFLMPVAIKTRQTIGIRHLGTSLDLM